jgi:hypothetical protein
VTPWAIHDLRRSSATHGNENGFAQPHVTKGGPSTSKHDLATKSETLASEALQHFSRLKNSSPGLFDKGVCTLNASAHLENVHEAVVQHVVDIVGQAPNGRTAPIFDALSETRSRLDYHNATSKPAAPSLCSFSIS